MTQVVTIPGLGRVVVEGNGTVRLLTPSGQRTDTTVGFDDATNTTTITSPQGTITIQQHEEGVVEIKATLPDGGQATGRLVLDPDTSSIRVDGTGVESLS